MGAERIRLQNHTNNYHKEIKMKTKLIVIVSVIIGIIIGVLFSGIALSLSAGNMMLKRN
ncbi:MAG: hypothetical protein IPH97_15075 [Ignavibacteriales bacterium]|nr:hypothetical protein [Ignavibacteriales bacterium]